MSNTKKIATSLASRYKTRDPFEIAKQMNCIITYAPLRGIRGFYQRYRKNNIIYIDEALSESNKSFVCAHELGHILMHKEYNRIFMDSCTFMVTSRYEKEADYFAVDLLYDDADLRPFLEYGHIKAAECLNLREDLAEYRLSTVEAVLW